MKIQIELDSAKPSHLSALIAAMIAYGSLTPDQLADVVSPWAMPDLKPQRGAYPTDVDKAALASDAGGLTTLLTAGAARASTIEIADTESESLEKTHFEIHPAAGVTTEQAAAMDDTLDAADAFKKAESTSTESASSVDPTTIGATLDKAGLPWDSRIHSASKAINQTDGLWRQKRGVNPDLVTTVNAELKQAMSVGRADTHGDADLDADAAKLTAMGADAGLTVGDIDEQGGVTGQLTKRPPPPPRKTPPISESETVISKGEPLSEMLGEITTFPQLLKFITEGKLQGKFNQGQVDAAKTAIGIEGPLPVLAARPDLIPAMVEKLKGIAA